MGIQLRPVRQIDPDGISAPGYELNKATEATVSTYNLILSGSLPRTIMKC